MTIQVELSPETEAWLAAQAASHRMDIPAYAASLLERAKHPNVAQPQADGPSSKHQLPAGRKSLAQLFAESPFSGLNLEFDKDRGIGRDFELGTAFFSTQMSPPK
jgi:hypothetical protein